MKRSTLIISGIALIVIVGTIYLNKTSEGAITTTIPQQTQSDVTSVPSEHESDGVNPPIDKDIVEIKMIARQWEFSPNVVEVNEGDVVTLSIESIDVAHGIGIPKFGVSEFLSPGKTTEVTFVADNAGTYSFFCNVQCGRGHGGMRGTIIVN